MSELKKHQIIVSETESLKADALSETIARHLSSSWAEQDLSWGATLRVVTHIDWFGHRIMNVNQSVSFC